MFKKIINWMEVYALSSYIIPYLDPKKHNIKEDPLFSEYTYGDDGDRGIILKAKVSRGGHPFFLQNYRK